ncbi:MAG: pirin-like C-terminal cupin domain-containing protein, partial [Acidimicrobiia bacterium]
FQIWLNLPPESKMVPAYFGMLWGEEIPTLTPAPGVSVDVIAGAIDGAGPPNPPPDSWASNPDSQLAIWLIRMDSETKWTLPKAATGTNRMLHCFQGDDVHAAATAFNSGVGAQLDPQAEVLIENRGSPAEFLLLQGRPIGAPVFQMGPFVMNSAEELRQAVDDYNRTQFGGWPWTTRDPVHAREEGRFALHADGTVERRDRQPV